MKNIFWLAAMGAVLCQPCAALAQGLQTPPLLAESLKQVRNGQLYQAIEAAGALRKEFPQQPYASIVAAQAYWEMIYCQTGHINSKEIWNVADVKTSPHDKNFLQALDEVLELSRELRQKPETAAPGALFAGLAQGARARLYAFRGRSRQAASESKQMRAKLLEAVAQDPQLEPEASVGLGAYNYYADVLSPILKFFRFFLRIPGGDRERGLAQLHLAAAKSSLWREEAIWELARIYGVREGRHAQALQLLQDLVQQYPDNPLYPLSAAYEAEGSGQLGVAIEYCQKAKKAAAKLEADCRPRILHAAQGALERLQGAGTEIKAAPGANVQP